MQSEFSTGATAGATPPPFRGVAPGAPAAPPAAAPPAPTRPDRGTEPDGWIGRVPAFFETETPGTDNKIVAGLCFRVGMADEPLPRRGISHLIEHLTLSGMSTPGLEYNGFVDALSTNFIVRGTPDEIVGYFNLVCAALATPDRNRLPLETQVLRAEAARKSPDLAATVMTWRSGAEGYGALASREYFLEQPHIDWLAYWIATHFTDGNAVFWCTGPVPDGVTLPLASGPRHPVPEATPLDQDYPAWAPIGLGGVALSVLRPVSVADSITVEVTRARLFEQLRMQRALSYEVGVRDDDVGVGRAHTVLQADCLPANGPKLRDAFVTEFRRLCLTGPSAEELERVLGPAERSVLDTDTDASEAVSRARAHLLGRPFIGRQSMLAQLRAIDVPVVRDRLDEMAATAIWMVPGETGWSDQRYVEVRPWSTTVATGPANPITLPEADHDQRAIAVDEHRVTMWFDAERRCAITVDFATCAAVVCTRDGTRDRRRRVLDHLRAGPLEQRIRPGGVDRSTGPDRALRHPRRPVSDHPGHFVHQTP